MNWASGSRGGKGKDGRRGEPREQLRTPPFQTGGLQCANHAQDTYRAPAACINRREASGSRTGEGGQGGHTDSHTSTMSVMLTARAHWATNANHAVLHDTTVVHAHSNGPEMGETPLLRHRTMQPPACPVPGKATEGARAGQKIHTRNHEYIIDECLVMIQARGQAYGRDDYCTHMYKMRRGTWHPVRSHLADADTHIGNQVVRWKPSELARE